MAKSALREQLSSYITRRVNAHAETAIDLYQQCSAAEWSQTEKARLLLDTAEKLSKLGNKLPHKPYAEYAQKISSLLKLGNIDEKPSHKAREGLREAVDLISVQLETESSLFGNLSSQIKTIFLALDEESATSLSALTHPSITIKYFDDTVDLDESCCLIISNTYQGNGLTLAKQIKTTAPSTHIIISGKDSFANRIDASKLQALCFLAEPIQIGELNQALEQYFSIALQRSPIVAVLDDSLSQLKYTENLLDKKGYRSIAFSDPEQTFNILEAYEPDVLLLDMYLPNCTGIDIAHALKQHIVWQALPVIFLSAEDDPDITTEAQQAFQAPFLSKPANPKRLCNAIMQAITLKQ